MQDKLKKRLEALYAKAESAKQIGNLEEAATFAAKVQELLVKYNLEMTDLDLDKNEPKADGRYFDFHEMHGWQKTDGAWLVTLYHVIATYNFGSVIRMGGNDKIALIA